MGRTDRTDPRHRAALPNHGDAAPNTAEASTPVSNIGIEYHCRVTRMMKATAPLHDHGPADHARQAGGRGGPAPRRR